MKKTTTFGAIVSSAVLVSMAWIGAEAKQVHQAAIVDRQLQCLALNVYFESRGESKLGQRAVAWVTLNRINDAKYPNTICEVVWQNKQFSWTHDGKSDKPKDQRAWEYAQFVATHVYTNYGLLEDPTEGAVMFHADYTTPYWADSYNKTVEIDNHVFYNRNS